MLLFLIVGSISILPIVHQEYAGVNEASRTLASLGFAHSRILSNAPQLELLLPGVTLFYLSPKNDTASITSLLRGAQISAVVIMHQRRGVWLQPSQLIVDLLRSHFHDALTSESSRYSWYEILYSSQSLAAYATSSSKNYTSPIELASIHSTPGPPSNLAAPRGLPPIAQSCYSGRDQILSVESFNIASAMIQERTNRHAA
jgi:hypothetical protein